MTWFPFPAVRVFAVKTVVMAVIAAFLIGGGIGFGSAWRIYGWKEAAADLVVERAATVASAKEEVRQHDIGVRHQNKRELIEHTFEEIEHATDDLVAARPELRDIDLGTDVLCLWRAANANRAAAAAGCRADAEVPAAAAAGERASANTDREPHADGEAVPPGVRGP